MALKTQKPSRQPVDDHARWQLYESLKARYTANATSSAEYAASCRRAAMEAGC